jgi:hypothetical protein
MKSLLTFILAFIATVLSCMLAIRLCQLQDAFLPAFRVRRQIHGMRAGRLAADTEAKLRAIFINKPKRVA